MSRTTILVPFGAAGGLQEVTATAVDDGDRYEIHQHAFVPLVPGDVLRVDEFGVTIEVHSYAKAFLVDFLFEDALGTDEVEHFALALHHEGVIPLVESSVNCKVAAYDTTAMRTVLEIAEGFGEHDVTTIRRMDRTPVLDIWTYDREGDTNG